MEHFLSKFFFSISCTEEVEGILYETKTLTICSLGFVLSSGLDVPMCYSIAFSAELCFASFLLSLVDPRYILPTVWLYYKIHKLFSTVLCHMREAGFFFADDILVARLWEFSLLAIDIFGTANRSKQLTGILLLRIDSEACYKSTSVHVVFKWLHITWWGHTASWKLPHNWLVKLAIDLATFCGMGAQNSKDGILLFWATHHPNPIQKNV